MATCSIDGLEALLRELDVGVPIPTFAGSDARWKPIDIYRSYLADTASKVLGCDAGLAYEAIQSAGGKDNSDLTLVLPKLKWGNSDPKDLAKETFMKFRSTPLFQMPLPDGVHLRFVFSTLSLPRLVLSYIHDRMEYYGQGRPLIDQMIPLIDGTTKKMIIEFSSPNLATKFSSHHLRSTVLGAQIANLYETMGWDVVRLNFLGDWGKEIGLLGVGWKKFGSEEAFQENPMGHLHDIYEKINEQFKPEKETSRKARDEGHDTAEIERQGIFAERDGFSKRMEDGESEEIGFWKRVRDASIAYYTHEYERLGVKFDEFSGESQVSPESIAEVESVLKEKGIYEESDGSWIIDYSKHGPKSLGVSVLRGRTGSTSYLLRDIAAVLDRSKKYSFDKMIYVVAAEQDVHFQKVFQALRYMGHEDLAAKLEHVNFGKVQGPSKGLKEAHLLGEILDQSVKDTSDALRSDSNGHTEINDDEKSVEILGVTSLITQYCGLNKRATSYTFNSQKLGPFEGNTGPSLQLCYAKLSAKINDSNPEEAVLANIDYTYLQEDPWMDLIRAMAKYPDAVDAAIKSHEPSLVLTYLFHLAEELQYCLNDESDDKSGSKRKTSPEEPPEAILAQTVLYKYAQQVLKNGMAILGIVPIS
ncbi:arginyl-tRNA synthetase [Annulohypoxylon maeteangense]|uniref:arginyl-tRNA synthetase n=1 Tax=Annulohypoxylon maeteangense TaxID=1927788 RepID=UPI002008BF1E|nr:arginyl-tRNA synthetase [Annulohypoxylon maeteangense]KAI0886707.1 arginyl-tRNA synthetase [Annulohypoxylon maeteangense]